MLFSPLLDQRLVALLVVAGLDRFPGEVVLHDLLGGDRQALDDRPLFESVVAIEPADLGRHGVGHVYPRWIEIREIEDDRGLAGVVDPLDEIVRHGIREIALPLDGRVLIASFQEAVFSSVVLNDRVCVPTRP